MEIEKAIEVLGNGGVIIYPTDTVYGLGCDIFNEDAVQKLRDLKGREFDKPISILMKKDWIEEYVEVNELAREHIQKYLPGPFTFILKKKEIVPEWISSNPYVGIRVIEEETAMQIVSDFGKPITTTSANSAGGREPNTCFQIDESIKEKVDLVVDKGETVHKGVSTIIRINEKIEILRQGVGVIGPRDT